MRETGQLWFVGREYGIMMDHPLSPRLLGVSRNGTSICARKQASKLSSVKDGASVRPNGLRFTRAAPIGREGTLADSNTQNRLNLEAAQRRRLKWLVGRLDLVAIWRVLLGADV